MINMYFVFKKSNLIFKKSKLIKIYLCGKTPICTFVFCLFEANIFHLFETENKTKEMKV